MKKRGRFHLPKIKTWQLLIILVPLLFADATLLRLSHVRMTELRDAVLNADEAEDDAATSAALEELKSYVFNNIVINVVEENGEQKITFGTGPFYLEHAYIRAANKALTEAEKNMVSDANPHGNVYGEASNTCRARALANGWTWNNPNFINCMLTEIQKYPAAEELQINLMANLPSTELYRKNYASPVWAPTLAGWAILVTIMIFVVIFIRMIIWLILRITLLFI